jgi:hypothetical protein
VGPHCHPLPAAADGQYELVVVSPRSYFLYTPLLPGAAAGSVQERSIMEPIRNLLQGQVGRLTLAMLVCADCWPSSGLSARKADGLNEVTASVEMTGLPLAEPLLRCAPLMC